MVGTRPNLLRIGGNRSQWVGTCENMVGIGRNRSEDCRNWFERVGIWREWGGILSEFLNLETIVGFGRTGSAYGRNRSEYGQNRSEYVGIYAIKF